MSKDEEIFIGMMKEIEEQIASAFGLPTSASGKPTTLTEQDVQNIIDSMFPVLYYGTSKFVLPKGEVIICKETEFNPEYIVCHPDDLETLRERLKGIRRLVHIKDEPPEESLKRLKKHLEKQYPPFPFFVEE